MKPWTEGHRQLRAEFDTRLRVNATKLRAQDYIAELLATRREYPDFMNDDATSAPIPGFTLLLSSHRLNDYSPDLHAHLREIGGLSLVERLQPAPDMVPGCYCLPFPNGGYFFWNGFMRVAETVDPESTEPIPLDFAIDGKLVVRAEGAGGWLWQNTDYDVDGSPR